MTLLPRSRCVRVSPLAPIQGATLRSLKDSCTWNGVGTNFACSPELCLSCKVFASRPWPPIFSVLTPKPLKPSSCSNSSRPWRTSPASSTHLVALQCSAQSVCMSCAMRPTAPSTFLRLHLALRTPHFVHRWPWKGSSSSCLCPSRRRGTFFSLWSLAPKSITM